jgi:methionine-rich copper-binding protein CopC
MHRRASTRSRPFTKRAISVLLMVAFAVGGLPASPAAAAPCDPPVTNPIPCENSKPGTPSAVWDISGAGDSSIQGFATDISVDIGETQSFKITTPASDYRLDIYRMGYYGGMGARLIATVEPSVPLPQSQPACLFDPPTNLVDCGNWSVSASWTVPADAVSGIYFAKLIREDGPSGASHVFFVVRDDDGASDMLFQTSDTTWQAYNQYGGHSLYYPRIPSRAVKVSYNRPFLTRDCCSQDFVFNAEYPMVRWLEANGYDVSYFTGVDSARYGNLLLGHEVFLSVGHDEYWSGQQRANVEAARDAGVNLGFFSGNEVFWKTRWEPSMDSSIPYRTLVTYKETFANNPIDPADPPTWTGTWRDRRFSPPADGGRPENALTGTLFMVNGPQSDSIEVPAADGKMRLWRNTSIANLSPGQTATLPNGTLGYEWDVDLDNGSRPAGLFDLSTTTRQLANKYLKNYGTSYGAGTAVHSLTLYRASSGALVFGAGTVQWPWGLDSNHDRGNRAPDTRMQQSTLNLFADMGVQPATIQPGLVSATASNDQQAPTSVIQSPSAGSSVQGGTVVTISGTASDTGGGVVGGVEVSTDGGQSWHPAVGRASWTYSWTPQAPGSTIILSRAVDDSANLGAPSGVQVTVDPRPCPCSVWSDSTTPSVASVADARAVSLGVRFRPLVDGFVTGIRFYKGAENTGTHVGHLWTDAGAQLGTVTFSGETSSGWQQALFGSPIPVTAGTMYVASYHTPSGRYAEDQNYFATSGVLNWPLEATPDFLPGRNGLFVYGSDSFPTKGSGSSNNFWVDVVFQQSAQDTQPPTVTGRTPVPGATGVATTSTVTATFNESVQPGSITFELRDPQNALVPATVTYDDPTRTARLTPSSPLAASTAYTASVRATDLAGNQMPNPVTWSFTTAAADTQPPAITAQAPAPGATGVATTSTVTATFDESVQPGSITFELRDPQNALVPATVTYDDPTRTARLTPSSPLAASTAYTASVRATDLAGNQMPNPVTWSFTTGTAPPPSGCPCSIWNASAAPVTASVSDTQAVELGVRFRSSQDGYIRGIRFYKGSTNTGTHIGHLWTSSGVLLATVTFTNETATGWQEALFSAPVPVTAGTVYVASYHTDVGRYAEDKGYFSTSGVVNGPLEALASGNGGNGVFLYGPSAFPSRTSRNGNNYWVDVVFTTTP